MLRKLSLLIVLVLLLAGTAHAQTPEPPHVEHTDPFWQVAYWNNTTLSGEPVITDSDQDLNHDWGSGAPRGGVNADRFSARWKRYVDVTDAGTYRFTATSDDGIRVYVDDDLVIDEWHDHAARTFVGDVNLTVGHHHVVVEYYENRGAAVAKLTWWGPVPITPHSWRGEYFADRQLSGEPVLVRDDPVDGESGGLDFDWGSGSPAAHIPSDGFAVRWTRMVPLEPGKYRFTAASDDGIRVWADDQLVIDQWHDHPAQTFTGDVNLTGENHVIVVEYYENMGYAVARVSWRPISATASWRGEYFPNRWLSGPPALVRDDQNLGFNWSYGSPASGIPDDNFSVRWTRTFHFEPGSYRFTTTTDDGVRLWVNDHLLIDQWHDQPLRPHRGTIHLSGDVPIKMEYYEHGGLASAWLTWENVDHVPPTPSPDVIVVDDTDRNCVKGGSATGWRTAAEGYGDHLTWTWNSDRTRYNYNWARWYPDLDPGRYEVFAFVPERYTTTSSARYWVGHRDGSTLRRVDQSTNGGRWVSLGIYWFRGSRSDYVSLADVTFEPYASRLIAFDAVKWEPR